MKVICTSDTHGMYNNLEIPDGDLFIFAGDISEIGHERELIDFNNFLGRLPHAYKIIVDGNHDLTPEKISELITNATYLQHELLEIENIKIWGTSWQYWLKDQIERTRNQMELSVFWQSISPDIDILITHFPPFGFGDLTRSGRHLGNMDLHATIRRIKPKYHIFGHVHEGYGIYKEKIDDFEIIYINASAIIGFNIDLNPPIVFTI
ncbi:MAG: metallophosphatase domain-containing protein [Promethearchaeota archaeon]